MNTKMDCYFFVDVTIPEEDRTISSLHVECRNEKMPDVGWFYQGSVEGYGPFEYKCALCGGIIHSANKQESEHPACQKN